MKLSRIIFTLFVLLSGVACRESRLNWGGNMVVATVEDKVLRISDLDGILPHGLSTYDSLSFVVQYAEKWIQNSVKLLEAERVFASSAHDIDLMVEQYRNSLMIRKLDKHHISDKFQPQELEGEVESYYKEHGSNFRLHSPLVKGQILTLPKSYKDSKQLLKEFSTYASKRGGDFASICEKLEFEFVEFKDEWIEYSDFLSRLPIVHRGRDFASYLSKRDAQQLEDEEFRYYFQITDALLTGEQAPLQSVRDKITYVLNNKKQLEFLREYEASLLKSAVDRGVVHNYSIEVCTNDEVKD